MEGMARAATRQADLAIITAWHTARFALNGYADKGRLAGTNQLSDLLPSNRDEDDGAPRTNTAEAVAFFHSMKAKGLDVQISKVVH